MIGFIDGERRMATTTMRMKLQKWSHRKSVRVTFSSSSDRASAVISAARVVSIDLPVSRTSLARYKSLVGVDSEPDHHSRSMFYSTIEIQQR